MRRTSTLIVPVLAVIATLATLLVTLLAPSSAQARRLPLEDFAPYQPAQHCHPQAKPGAVELQRVIVRRFGGSPGRIGAPCDGTVSEHHEGRALDWMVSARTAAGRHAVDRLLAWLFNTDARGDLDVRARRMGVMYVIWDDQIYGSYRQFAPEAYKNAACRHRPLRRCSPTLRHQDHVHISLSRAGGKGLTSWYAGRLTSEAPGARVGGGVPQAPQAAFQPSTESAGREAGPA